MASKSIILAGCLLSLAALGCSPTKPSSNPTAPGLPAAGESREVRITDRLGRSVTLSRPPARIISLSPSATEMIFAVGAGDRLVGLTQYCNYPSDALTISRVSSGTIEGVNREAILDLKPDVIFFKADHHQSLIDTFDKFGIPMVGVGAESIQEMFQEALDLGRFLKTETVAEQLVAQMRSELEMQRRRVSSISDDARKRVFYVVWDDPLMTAGPQSFIGELIGIAKGKNIFDDVKQGYPQISSELVVDRDPQVIIRPSSGDDTNSLDRILGRKGWEGISAIRDKQVRTIDGDQISRCGPRLLQVLPSLIDAIYPELKTQ
ncbi:MAG: ABC transporter substrate-binding protein [Pirellula sp.]